MVNSQNTYHFSLTATKRKFWIVVSAILACFLAVLWLFKSYFIAAVVNGEIVWRPSIDTQLEQTYGGPVTNDYIGDILIAQEARKKGIVISQQEFNQRMDTIAKEFISEGQTIDSYAANLGETRDQFNHAITIQLINEKLFGSKIRVTDADIQQFITANADQIPKDMPQEKVKAAALQQLTQNKMQSLRDAEIQKLKKQAHIWYFIQFPA